MHQLPPDYPKLLNLVRTHGLDCAPLRVNSPNSPFTDDAHRKRFLSACHSGFEKAQNRIVELLCSESELASAERPYQEVLLRKIADAIAYTLIRSKSHIMRRMALHDSPPACQPDVLRAALKEANKLNSESRMTFALVADATTFVHLGDLLRVDHRRGGGGLSIIELKTGMVNAELMRLLEDLPPTDESIEQVQKDISLHSSKRKQAVRMLRQRVRLVQTQNLLEHDRGIDIKSKKPIYLSKREIEEESYDSFLEELLVAATKSGISSGTLNYCFHFGVGFNENHDRSWKLALDAAKYAAYEAHRCESEGAQEVRLEIEKVVPNDDLFRWTDLVRSNLNCVPCRPLTLWSIDKELLLTLLSGKLTVAVLFSITSFIWLARSAGIPTQLSSRKRAAECAKEMGKRQVPTWGGRGVEFLIDGNPQFMLSGMMSRFFNDLYCPLAYLRDIRSGSGWGENIDGWP